MKNSFLYKNDGFSLIEVAILLVVIGLIATPLITIYNNERAQLQIQDTQGKMTVITSAINRFVANEGRYPIPTNLYLTDTDADYGIEFAGAIQDCAGWPTPEGVCQTTAPAVIIGGVPFDALGLNPDDVYDSWNQKILYAITASQTVAATFAQAGAGQIIVQAYDDTNAIVDIETAAYMVLISHGENNRGAYSRNGNLRVACEDAGNFQRDDENCNQDHIFFLRTNDQLAPPVGSVNYVEGPNYYDDLTAFEMGVPGNLWDRNSVNDTSAQTEKQRIGIGTETPNERFHVRGNIRANRVLSNALCRENGADCFNPSIIAGNDPNMNCEITGVPGTQPIIRIGENRAFCASPVDSGGNPIDGMGFSFPANHFNSINCADSGQLMRGIDSNGDPICAAIIP